MSMYIDVISAEVSLVNVGDSETLPTLLNPLRRKVHSTSADGAYNTKKYHEVLQSKDYKTLIPPRKMLVIGREPAVDALKSDILCLKCHHVQVGEALAKQSTKS